jgi:hypothetical protein
LQRQSTTKGVGNDNKMRNTICKVVAQTEPVYVPSKKQNNGQLAKSMIRLKELGGEYEDEYICAMFGNLALCKFAVGKTVIASLRFQTHELNGSVFQDVVANDIQNI